MNMKLVKLMTDIQETRQALYSLMSEKPLCDEIVVTFSQKLDKLLNEYEKLSSTLPQ